MEWLKRFSVGEERGEDCQYDVSSARRCTEARANDQHSGLGYSGGRRKTARDPLPYLYVDTTLVSPEVQKLFERVRNSADFMPLWQMNVRIASIMHRLTLAFASLKAV